MNKNEAMQKLEKLKERAGPLINQRSDNQDFKKWYRDTQVALERIFGEDTRHLKDFLEISFSLSCFSTGTPESSFENAYRSGVNSSITLIDSFIDEIHEYWNDESENNKSNIELSSIHKVELIINRFHQVARQLCSRYSDRPTLEIDDEYDVQYLFHALLKLYLNDVRAEEYTPSYAGAASRVDFLLKSEKIIVEIKKTRKNMNAKDVGEQLIIDTMRYQAHPDCNSLICFVYDPEGRIANPRGLEIDLSKEINSVPVSVFITPEQ